MKKAALHNLGCKVNAYETEAMQEMLEKAGYEIVPFKEGADIYIINTCTVTNIADRKSRQMLHRARKMNPDAIVVAAGCYVQAQEGKEIDPCIDIVLGNNHKKDLIKILEEYSAAESTGDEKTEDGQETRCAVAEIEDINKTHEYETLHLTRPGDHTRAYIKVQDGCNQFCTYCIIPYARGRVRSRRPEDVVGEVKNLAANGYQEIVLTGIHLGQWGLDFEEKKSFLHLLQAIEDTPIERYRIGSLEPPEISDEVIDFLSSSRKFAHHLHLSLQSGCDEILALMKRHYDVAFYSDIVHKLKRRMPDIFLGSDIIVGFPSETDEQFKETYENLSKLPLSDIHVFPYSLRKNTIASKIEPQVTDDKKRDRADSLKALAHEKKREFLESMRGQTLRVLIERKRDKKTGYLKGISGNYINILVDDERDLCNTMQNVLVKNIFENRAFGKIID